ncbi:MAG: hypothetical protein R3F53_17955 [Gammaproteobacteria bacterium]
MFFDIQPKDVEVFKTGEEASEIWDWLKARNRLGELPEALRYIDREDLALILEPLTPATATEPNWQGSPFPGLRAFAEQDAPIFSGASGKPRNCWKNLPRRVSLR